MALKTVILVSIATARMIFPGAPTIDPPNTPERTLPYSKSISVSMWSDSQVNDKSQAEMQVPEGLKVGSSVKLDIDYTPVEKVRAAVAAAEKLDRSFTYKSYWGSAETVLEKQPKVTPPNQTEEAGDKSPLPALKYPETSYAFWPGYKPVKFDTEAATPGSYQITTNYAGSTSFTIEPQQDFLAPVYLYGIKNRFDLEKPIKVQWKSVPNALAYIVSANGGDSTTTVSWTSSFDPEIAAMLEDRPLSSEQVSKYIADRVLLSPATTSCTIPAGIFKGCEGAMLTVTAIGMDKLQVVDGIETRIVVRSTANVPIKGAYELPDPVEDKIIK